MSALDSYECMACGLWSHYPPPSEEFPGAPDFCPYCGRETIHWRSDNMYEIEEIF